MPVLASDYPGFRESCALPDFLLADTAPPQAWLDRLDDILRRAPGLSAAAAGFAAGFTSRRSAEVLLDAVRLAALEHMAMRR